MSRSSRRAFLSDVGRGMLAAGVGVSLATELNLIPAFAAEEKKTRLTFGALDPLASLIQETPPDKLLPIVSERLAAGLELKTLVAAASLANARAFGGQDYIGYHTFMALAPAWQMAQELPSQRAALPVLKVLYRNAARIQAAAGGKDKLEDHHDLPAPAAGNRDEIVQAASRTGDVEAADRTFSAIAKDQPGEAYNHLQFAVEDEVDVHRVVLCWRSWATRDLTGQEHATTLLRQSIRYCADTESRIKSRNQTGSPIRTLLPKLLDEHKLLAATPGTKRADEAWLKKMSSLVAGGGREEATGAIAAALAEGISPEDVGMVLTLAANELVLRDPGRPKEWSSAEKPEGSVHGDSVGVHASDAANAWRHIASVSNPRNVFASLIVGAYHTAGQSGRLNKDFYPTAEHLEKVQTKDATKLLAELDEAVRAKDQFRAAAITQRYGELGHDANRVFDTFREFATSEDGALHAEKYYRTCSEEFSTLPAAFRWRELVALARVTASEYGRPAPGYALAKELLKV